MKRRTLLTRWAGAVAGAAMVCSVSSQAAVDVTAFTFDADASTWLFSAWGGQGTASVWDGGQGSPSAGCIYVVQDFTGGDQLVDLGWFLPGGQWWSSTTLDLTAYTNISFRVFIDSTNSTISKATWESTGEQVFLWLIGSGNSWIENTAFHFTIPDAASNGWVTVDVPLTNTAIPGIGSVIGLGIKKWTGTGFTGKFCFFVDDFQIWAGGTPPPPPVLSVVPAAAKLHQFSDTGGGRMNIRSVASGAGGPIAAFYGAGVVNYSFTVNQWNDTSNFGFQQHLFLVPNATANSAADWENPNCVFMDLESPGDGSAQWVFRYKTNAANNNTQIYDTNYNWTLTNSSIVGTWTLTFSNNTDVFMTAPDGTSTNFVIDDPTAQLLGSGDLQVYYGVMSKSGSSIGSSVVLSKVQFDSPTFGVTDTTNVFTTVLDTNVWQDVSGAVGTQVIVPANAKWLLGTTPWSGYYIQLGTNGLTASSWTTNGAPAVVQHGSTMYGLLSTDSSFTPTPVLFPATSGELFIIANKYPTQ